MKKSNKILASVLAGACILGGGFALAGCGEAEFTPDKAQLSQALSEVASAMTGTSAQVSGLSYNSEDFVAPAEDDMTMLRCSRMNVFASEICKNEDFELAFKDAFDCYINDSGIELEVKMCFDYQDGITKYEFLVTDALQNPMAYEYLNVEIDYDYENNVINSFILEDYFSGIEEYGYFEYSNGGLKMLSSTTESFITAKNITLEKAQTFIDAEYTDTEYDFSEEYATAMGLN